MKTKTPNPGSREAFDQGCICPVLDNAYGRGYYGNAEKNGYVIVMGCPVHDEKWHKQMRRETE